MKPLSSFNYIRNNTKKILPTYFSILVGVLLVYFYSLISTEVYKTIDFTNLTLSKKFTFVYSNNNNPIPSDLLNYIKNSPNLKSIVSVKPLNSSLRYKNILSDMSYDSYNLFTEDISPFINSVGNRLIAGRIPKENAHEILIHKRYALQNNLKVGDFIGSQISDDYKIQGKYRISGIMDGPSLFAILNDNEQKYAKEDSLKYTFFFSCKNTDDKSILDYLEKNSTPNIFINDYDSNKASSTATLTAMSCLTFILTAFMIIVLCISVGNLNYISFMSRKSEFSILNALGYKKSKLIRKLWKENLIICFLGYISGIAITTIVAELLNIAIYEPSGELLTLYSLSGMLIIIILPILVSILSLIPCLKIDFSSSENFE